MEGRRGGGEKSTRKNKTNLLFFSPCLAVGGHARGRTASIDQERPPHTFRDSLPQGCSRPVIERRHDNRRVTESRETLDLEPHRIIGDFACPFHQLALDVTLLAALQRRRLQQTGYFSIVANE